MEQQQPILPDTLRAISLGVLIVAALFRILHWPGADLVLVIAWLVAVAAVVARITALVPRWRLLCATCSSSGSFPFWS
jgi:hypothetical protein